MNDNKEKKDYFFDSTKTEWGDIQYFIQALIAEQIKEDVNMGYEADEFSDRLSVYIDIMRLLDSKKDNYMHYER